MKNCISLLAIIIVGCIFLFGCKTKQGQENRKSKIEETSKSKGENFDTFYSKFMLDIKFQKSRVIFPLKCDISEPERNLKSIEEQQWVPMKVPIGQVDRNVYKVKVTKTPNIVTHRIYIENSDTDILLKYKQIKGKWYLIYYKSIFL
ncbi:DUF4348 domain-containing protein, partial [Dysgonomonas sp. HGC4]|uniref:DUF4348 domain-containing protein n=1 Tax=Dysgonomonas sp. HGC4 TaxID=1658009 RepID=UPI000682D887